MAASRNLTTMASDDLKTRWHDSLAAWGDHSIGCPTCFDTPRLSQCEIGQALVAAEIEAWVEFNESRWTP